MPLMINKKTTDGNAARIARNNADTEAVDWWLRSPGSATDFRVVFSNGGAGNGNASKPQVAAMLSSILNSENRTSEFNIQNPHYLDATDALAVAYTCHLQLSNPLADLRSQLAPKKKQRKSSKQQWSDFVNQNPDRIL